MTIGVVNKLEHKSEYESQKIQQNKQQMESNLVQPWDRIDSGKNTLNERPKRSKFLTTANLSSITQRLQLHGHVTKKGRKNKGGGLDRQQTGYSYMAPHSGNPLSLKEENVPITIGEKI